VRPILVLGSGGMLGRDVVAELERRKVPCLGMAHSQCDVTVRDDCRGIVERHKPRIVINCAAFTDVNGAETRSDAAWRVNAMGAENVAASAARVGAACYFISTDYVFDGTKQDAYGENDLTSPINAYGSTKLEGEKRTAEACADWAVFRTSWLYGEHGKNFVSTMLQKARDKAELCIVSDQIGAPTCTHDLACLLADSIDADARGIFHATCSGACSWFEFAQAIFRIAGVHPLRLEAASSSAYSAAARRPANSQLKDTRLKSIGVAPLPHWREALNSHLKRIGAI
jgi:dTDP-4-dehydrorhamnose reductase